MIKEYTIKSRKTDEEYSVVLSIENGIVIPHKTSCTCKHGSFYRFTQKNVAAQNWQCSHIKEAIKKHEKGEIDNIETERGLFELNGKRKEIHPIF